MKKRLMCLLAGSAFLLLGAGSLYSGGETMAQWTMVKDAHAHFQAGFPHEPSEMEFDIHEEESHRPGHLQVYLSPTDHAAFFVCVLSSETFTNFNFDAKEFQEIFHSYFVIRMLYDPHLFEKSQSYSQESRTLQGYSGIRFNYLYEENGTDKRLAGQALLKDHQLYVVFYMTKEGDFNKVEFDKFIDSFKFTD